MDGVLKGKLHPLCYASHSAAVCCMGAGLLTGNAAALNLPLIKLQLQVVIRITRCCLGKFDDV